MAPTIVYNDFLRAERRQAQNDIDAKFRTLEAIAEGLNTTL